MLEKLATFESLPEDVRSVVVNSFVLVPFSFGAVMVADEISLADAQGYISDLIDSQILVADIGVPLTGNDATDAVVAQLAQRPATSIVANVLRDTRESLAALDRGGLGNPADSYRSAARVLEQLPAAPDLSRALSSRSVQSAPELSLDQAVLDELMAGISILHRLAPRPSDQLQEFREAFIERYEAQEVPLVEALDDEFGIGFGSADTSPLLHGIAFPRRSGKVRSGHRATRSFLKNSRMRFVVGIGPSTSMPPTSNV